MIDLPPPTPSVEIVVQTEGMSDGVRQTPGAQLQADFRLTSGPVFGGVSYKNIGDLIEGFETGETNAYVGVSTEVEGFSVSLSAAYKRLTTTTVLDSEALEIAGEVSRDVGILTPRVFFEYSPDDLGDTGRVILGGAGLNARVGDSLLLGAEVLRSDNRNGTTYTAWNAGARYRVHRNVSLEVRYYDTDRHDVDENYRSRVVGMVRLNF